MAGLKAFIALVALAATTLPARAADPYPSRPIRAVVPLFTGAGTDIIARRMTAQLAQNLGQQIVVDNRPGASTTLGTHLVAKSTPDGYTLLVATTKKNDALKKGKKQKKEESRSQKEEDEEDE